METRRLHSLSAIRCCEPPPSRLVAQRQALFVIQPIHLGGLGTLRKAQAARRPLDDLVGLGDLTRLMRYRMVTYYA